jgi:hypothetical protein
MEKNTEKLLLFCSQLAFGEVPISEEEKTFGQMLSDEILYLCKSLPDSTRTDAVLFFLEHYNVSFSEPINFLKYYYTPAWSVLYWINKSAPPEKKIGSGDLKNLITVHAMAMLLHVLDDHLTDAQIPVNHLSLLIRSQAWRLMLSAGETLYQQVEQGKQIFRTYLNDYYSGIRSQIVIKSLDQYCDLFKKQMGISLTAPVLLTKLVSDDHLLLDTVISAYTSFGVAWRLLDDIQDIKNDIIESIPSAVYFCLPDEDRKRVRENKKQKRGHQIFFESILRNDILNIILNNICDELHTAATITEKHVNPGLAHEFQALVEPLIHKRYCL